MNELIDTFIDCPYCGEQIEVAVEVLDEPQHYIEDCQVCCRPITFIISSLDDEYPSVSVLAENDTY